jgi:hypothetical protein
MLRSKRGSKVASVLFVLRDENVLLPYVLRAPADSDVILLLILPT